MAKTLVISLLLYHLFYSVKFYPIQIEQAGTFFFSFKFDKKRFNASRFCGFSAVFSVVSSTF